MSKPRYRWWGYVKNVIRCYPQLVEENRDLYTAATTTKYSEMPGGGEPRRTVEELAIRELPRQSQREYEAVRAAIRYTASRHSGRDQLKIIDLVFWKRSHTLEGAALVVSVSIATAWRWHGEFIRTVARYMGLLDES